MLLKYLKAALVFALVSAASAQTIIYRDYTSGFSTVLPISQNVTAVVDTTYYTFGATPATPQSYDFGVDWNNDAQDQYSITIPSTVLVTATNDQSFCQPSPTTSPPNQITFTETSPHQCNYTATWIVPFNGVLTVTYNGGPNTTSIASDAISTFFKIQGAVGDPQFLGLRGQSFQVHGVDGAVYNIISEKNLQVNSRFAFLTEGECPIIDGAPDDNCWSHPGSYMGEMSFQTVQDGKLQGALVAAGDAKKGFSQVQLNGRTLKVGDVVVLGTFSMELKTTHLLSIHTENYEFELTNSDMFINYALRSKVPLNKLDAHGLLGQTHTSKVYKNTLKYVEGEVDDYVIASDDIFGLDFLFNKFQL